MGSKHKSTSQFAKCPHPVLAKECAHSVTKKHCYWTLTNTVFLKYILTFSWQPFRLYLTSWSWGFSGNRLAITWTDWLSPEEVLSCISKNSIFVAKACKYISVCTYVLSFTKSFISFSTICINDQSCDTCSMKSGKGLNTSESPHSSWFSLIHQFEQSQNTNFFILMTSVFCEFPSWPNSKSSISVWGQGRASVCKAK